MKKIRVPILTEEYKIDVFIGKRPELIRAVAKHTTYSPRTVERDFENRRALTYDLYHMHKHPLLVVDDELSPEIVIAAVGHEAVHAVDYLMNYVKISSEESEFRGHGVGAILRAVFRESNLENKSTGPVPPSDPPGTVFHPGGI